MVGLLNASDKDAMIAPLCCDGLPLAGFHLLSGRDPKRMVIWESGNGGWDPKKHCCLIGKYRENGDKLWDFEVPYFSTNPSINQSAIADAGAPIKTSCPHKNHHLLRLLDEEGKPLPQLLLLPDIKRFA